MNKIALIIRREYKSRVMKPSFIILTFLTPILIAALVMVPLFLAQIKDDAVKKIVVIDKTGLYTEVFQNTDNYEFIFVNLDLEVFKETQAKSSYSAVLYIPEDITQYPKSATLYSEDQVGMEVKSFIGGLLKTYAEAQQVAALNIPDFKALVEQTKVPVDIKTVRWGKDGEEKMGSAELALIIGMITAFVIYMFIVVYGAQVMAGVVQEQTNRIVEVIVSSVKPFQLMMGKIIGIALVGLTQFALWVVLSLILITIGMNFMGNDLQMQSVQDLQTINTGIQPYDTALDDNMAGELLLALNSFDFVQTGIMFIIFFLGGYLLYASLFAAIGSAVDNETDTQQFSLPLMLPIIFAIYAAIYSVENPDGPLAFWCSMIPFTSPIVMMVRLPFGVPFWQLSLSVGILILSFIVSTWIAGKIYRTGILMYGKKVSWKEMMKWIFYKA